MQIEQQVAALFPHARECAGRVVGQRCTCGANKVRAKALANYELIRLGGTYVKRNRNNRGI